MRTYFIKSLEEEMIITEKHEQMVDIIIHNWLFGRDTSTYFAYEFFDKDVKEFNRFIRNLVNKGYLVSNIENNYGTLSVNEFMLNDIVLNQGYSSVDELKSRHRIKCKSLNSKENQTEITYVKHRNKIDKASFHRKGFLKAANTVFSYDADELEKIADKAMEQVLKGMDDENKDIDLISYPYVACDAIASYTYNKNVYTLGKFISDARGRAIFEATRKVFNPIQHKIARTLLKCSPRKLTKQGRDNVFTFIARLNGSKKRNAIQEGKDCYEQRKFPGTYEDLWLKRIYNALDENKEYWNIPVYIDATASVMQIVGALLGNKEYLRLTNVIADETDNINDIWKQKGVDRTLLKKVLTQTIYGSSKSVEDIVASLGKRHSGSAVRKLNECLNGLFKSAYTFGSKIIEGVTPEPRMTVTINNEQIEIICNKIKYKQTIPVAIPVYIRKYKIIRLYKRTKEVADLENFRRYFVTLLIHNLDSQIADTVCNNLDWVIPIHDAFIIHPNDVLKTKHVYSLAIKDIYKNRISILNNYLKSIGYSGEIINQNITEEKYIFCDDCLS